MDDGPGSPSTPPALRPPRHMVEVVVDPIDVDLVSGALWSAGAVAVEERDAGARVELRSTSDEASSPAALVQAVQGRSAGLLGAPAEVRVVTIDDDGLDAWRDHARPWRAGSHIVVWPGWWPEDATHHGERPGPDDLVVRIDPGRAFGSGSHPSTRSALGVLERLVGPGTRLLDVGCGSGILAVTAARLGATSATAVDVDPEAVTATAANAAANGVTDRVDVAPTPLATLVLDPLPTLVVANILSPVLLELASHLVDATAPGGHLVVAGLLDDQVEAVVSSLGLPVSRVDHDEGWACVTLVRPPVGAIARQRALGDPSSPAAPSTARAEPTSSRRARA